LQTPVGWLPTRWEAQLAFSQTCSSSRRRGKTLQALVLVLGVQLLVVRDHKVVLSLKQVLL
jgi:hypothetical protein